ncbi:MAG: hypothetical protein WAT74_09805, partial [Flavobacteriales bacterium]
LFERFQHHLALEGGGELASVSSAHGWKLASAFFLSRFSRPPHRVPEDGRPCAGGESYYERMKERLLKAMPDWKGEEEENAK